MSSAVVPPGRGLSTCMAVCTCNCSVSSHEISIELNVRINSFFFRNFVASPDPFVGLRKERRCPNFLTSYDRESMKEFQNFKSCTS